MGRWGDREVGREKCLVSLRLHFPPQFQHEEGVEALRVVDTL
jgi:hypothetical protein